MFGRNIKDDEFETLKRKVDDSLWEIADLRVELRELRRNMKAHDLVAEYHPDDVTYSIDDKYDLHYGTLVFRINEEGRIFSISKKSINHEIGNDRVFISSVDGDIISLYAHYYAWYNVFQKNGITLNGDYIPVYDIKFSINKDDYLENIVKTINKAINDDRQRREY